MTVQELADKMLEAQSLSENDHTQMYFVVQRANESKSGIEDVVKPNSELQAYDAVCARFFKGIQMDAEYNDEELNKCLTIKLNHG